MRTRKFQTGLAQEYAKAFAEKNRKAYNRIKESLGDRAPSFDEFMRLTQGQFKDLNHDAKTLEYIHTSQREGMGDEHRRIAEAAYFSFKQAGLTIGGHAMAQFAIRQRRPDGTFKFNFDTVINNFNQRSNYLDTKTDRDVRFYNGIALITEANSLEIVTIMVRSGKPPKKWKEI